MLCKTPRISIVIRALDEEEHIGRLLEGIRAQSVPMEQIEVIVVDSGSTDRTVAIAKSYGCRVLSIEKSEFSFGRALNIGCDAATGEILVFASAHVYPVHHDWLERLVAPFKNARVVLSYGRQQGGPTNKYSEHRLFEAWFPKDSTSDQKTYFCNNANCAVRRSAWLENRYDEVLTGLEDLDWAKRAQKRGGRIAYAAEASIVHVHEETWPQVRNRYYREALALRQIEPHMRFGWIDFLFLFARHVLHDAYRAYAENVLRAELGGIILFRYNQLWGTFLGYRRTGAVTKSLKMRFYYPPTTDEARPPELKRSPAASAVFGGDAERRKIVYSSR